MPIERTGPWFTAKVLHPFPLLRTGFEKDRVVYCRKMGVWWQGVWNEMTFVYNGGVESRLLGMLAAKDSLELIAKVPESEQEVLTKKWFEMFPGGG